LSGKRVAALAIIGLLVLVVVVLVVAQPDRERDAREPGDTVAVVHLQGTIEESGAGGAFAAPVISPEVVRSRLEAAEDRGAAAVILRMDTGGGAVGASQEIHDLVRDFHLPVVVSMGDIVASGGYYISAGADRIVAQPGSLTGSIGVIWVNLDVSGLLDEWGITLEAVTSGEQKDMFLPLGWTDEQRDMVQALSDEVYDQFVAAVAEGRELSESDARELATGEVFNGANAVELGLVDELGGLDVAVAAAEDLAGIEDAEIIDLRPTFFEIFFGGPSYGVEHPLDRFLRRGPVETEDRVGQLRQLLETYSGPRYEVP
jgi:protease IV